MPAWVLVFFSPGGSTGTGQCCVRISCAFDAQIHGLRRLLIAANIERRQVRGIDLDEALKTANENAVRPHPRHAPSDQSTAPPSGTARHARRLVCRHAPPTGASSLSCAFMHLPSKLA